MDSDCNHEKELCHALIKWLQTFSLPISSQSVDDLIDGTALGLCLGQIDPDYFDEAWQSGLRSDTGNNWRLHASNLKTILSSMQDYYYNYIHKELVNFPFPDIDMLAKLKDECLMGRFLQVLLGCAIECNHKQDYIEVIMSLDEVTQTCVMAALQELMVLEVGVEKEEELDRSAIQLKRSHDEVQRLLNENTDLYTKLNDLDSTKSTLVTEKAALQMENDRLRDNNSVTGMVSTATDDAKKVAALNSQGQELMAENYRLEAAREELEVKYVAVEKEASVLRKQVEELQPLAAKAQYYKDELDHLEENSEKIAKFESIIEQYKKKVEDLSNLKKQIKILDAKNAGFVETIVGLEGEVTRAQMYRAQCETYKVQLQEAQQKMVVDTTARHKAEFDSNKTLDKFNKVSTERDRLLLERDQLKETLEETKMDESNHHLNGELRLTASPMFDSNPELREKLIKLEHENKSLKMDVESSERVSMMQTMLDASKERQESLEDDLKEANQKIISLESEVDDFEQSSKSNATLDELESRWKRRLVEVQEKLKLNMIECRTKSKHIDDLKSENVELATSLAQSTANHSTLEREMAMMEEKYRKYLDKARSVIKTLDPRHNPTIAPEIKQLRADIRAKEAKIAHLEEERDKMRGQRDTEDKLMVSAWYNMGQVYHRRAIEDRLSSRDTKYARP